jgi:hypothetical protein
MTEVELEILRLRLRVEVHQELLRGLYTGLANSSPTAAQVFRDQFAILRQERSKIAIRSLSPATSDMIAAEYQEALEDVLSNIEAGFRT